MGRVYEAREIFTWSDYDVGGGGGQSQAGIGLSFPLCPQILFLLFED